MPPWHCPLDNERRIYFTVETFVLENPFTNFFRVKIVRLFTGAKVYVFLKDYSAGHCGVSVMCPLQIINMALRWPFLYKSSLNWFSNKSLICSYHFTSKTPWCPLNVKSLLNPFNVPYISPTCHKHAPNTSLTCH